ncbi:MAG: acyl carrier protein [Planctomycetes bacterium]|nr:acyl carrier protein [Planctomycetota bacterium]MCB9869294.1 acyl carrier protein [Planctomycetota bacterium]
MTRQTVDIDRVKQLIVQCLNLTDVQPADIADEDPLFVEGLGLDSVDALELVLGVEQEFGLQIEDEAVGAAALASARALTDFINQRLEAQARTASDA